MLLIKLVNRASKTAPIVNIIKANNKKRPLMTISYESDLREARANIKPVIKIILRIEIKIIFTKSVHSTRNGPENVPNTLKSTI